MLACLFVSTTLISKMLTMEKHVSHPRGADASSVNAYRSKERVHTHRLVWLVCCLWKEQKNLDTFPSNLVTLSFVKARKTKKVDVRSCTMDSTNWANPTRRVVWTIHCLTLPLFATTNFRVRFSQKRQSRLLLYFFFPSTIIACFSFGDHNGLWSPVACRRFTS